VPDLRSGGTPPPNLTPGVGTAAGIRRFGTCRGWLLAPYHGRDWFTIKSRKLLFRRLETFHIVGDDAFSAFLIA